MAKIAQVKLTIDLVAKTPYKGSGPRGVDVYARNLYDSLSTMLGSGNVYLSHDRSSGRHVDLTHYTFFDPFFLSLWGKLPRNRFVVTVHDLIPIVFESKFKIGIRGKLKWLLQKSALNQASAIITDSECSKTDIAKLTNISPVKIHVVPLAAGHTLVTDKLVKVVKKEYSLSDKYLLYVGDINWNKNVPGLIDAFSKLKTDADLVLVGKAFVSSRLTPEYHLINQAITRTGLSSRIHLLGFVPSHHLSAIYKGAELYIQPSWYEGFGFPVLEALEQGTPVACANTGSLPEVGGNYVHYFNPGNPKEFVSLLKLLLSNDELRTKFSNSGKIWAHSFTWNQVVKRTREVYEKLL